MLMLLQLQRQLSLLALCWMGEGGATIYGGLRPAKVSVENRYLPLGLSNKARLIKPVLPDQVLTFDDVELDANRLAFQMRRETEALLN